MQMHSLLLLCCLALAKSQSSCTQAQADTMNDIISTVDLTSTINDLIATSAPFVIGNCKDEEIAKDGANQQPCLNLDGFPLEKSISKFGVSETAQAVILRQVNTSYVDNTYVKCHKDAKGNEVWYLVAHGGIRHLQVGGRIAGPLGVDKTCTTGNDCAFDTEPLAPNGLTLTVTATLQCSSWNTMTAELLPGRGIVFGSFNPSLSMFGVTLDFTGGLSQFAQYLLDENPIACQGDAAKACKIICSQTLLSDMTVVDEDLRALAKAWPLCLVLVCVILLCLFFFCCRGRTAARDIRQPLLEA